MNAWKGERDPEKRGLVMNAWKVEGDPEKGIGVDRLER